MHLVWSHPTTGAELWCGGMNAGKDASFMKQNGINCTLSAASCPPMAQDSRIKNFGQYDGTGMVAGHWPWETIKGVVNSVIAELCDGKRVLIACRNGTGRSATWCALVLMALTGDLPRSVCDHLVAIRSVVQFACHTKRRGTSRFVLPEQSPLEWLESKHGEMAAIAESLASKKGSDRFQLNGVLPPSRFRDLVKSLGFQELEQAGAFLVFNGTG